MTDEIPTAPGTPTQYANPKRTTWRSFVQTVLGVLGGLLSTILVAALVAPEVLAALRDLLDPAVYALLATLVATIVTIGTGITRIMAIPRVARWIEKHLPGLAPIKP